MSPYKFYQSWIQADDAELEKLFKQLTLVPVAEIDSILTEHTSDPGARSGQKRLAAEMTTLVHGESSTASAVQATGVLFGSVAPGELDSATLELLATEVPNVKLGRDMLGGENLADLLAGGEVVASKGEARRMLDQNGISINGEKVAADGSANEADLLHGRYLLVRKGKKAVHLLDFD